MADKLKERRIAILVTDGFEQVGQNRNKEAEGRREART